jgi:hypothetical protein
MVVHEFLSSRQGKSKSITAETPNSQRKTIP